MKLAADVILWVCYLRANLATGNGAAIANDLIKCADTFDAYQNQIEEDGVFFTPTFLVCDEIFVGREHLPLIEKIITDRQS